MSEVRVQIALTREDFPSPDDRRLRRGIEDAIEDAGLGDVIQSGGGIGVMEIVLEVRSRRDAISQLHVLLSAHGLRGRYTLDVLG